MNELEFQEEWLSAYLDDELTEAQRQVVEQRLAIDPAAQATLEDLQRVRSMVAKLPSWSGPDLKFAVPVGAPGSFDDADDELEHEPRELDDFEDVPRAVGGADEPRPAFRNANSRGDFNARSLRSTLAWGAMAATVLLVAGVGSVYYWPSPSPTVAFRDAASNGPAELGQENANLNNFAANNAMENTGLEGSGLAPGGAVDSGSAVAFGAPATGDQSGARLSEPSDPAPAAKKSEPQAGGFALQAEPPTLSDIADAKLSADMSPTASSPLPAPPGTVPGGLGGIAGATSPTDLAMNNAPTDAPAAELPPPAPMRASGIDSAETTNIPSPDGLADKLEAAGQSALPANAFYYARSQSWSDDETLSRLSYTTPLSQANQLAYGNDLLQRGDYQNRNEATTESVLMAAIKPEVANSPEFFQNIVTSNRLVEVDQGPLLNQYSVANAASGNEAMANAAMANATQTADPANNAANSETNNALANNAVASGRLEVNQNNAYSIQSQARSQVPNQNVLGLNRYSNQRYQTTQSNQPLGNSIVLFLTRDEANQILNQLQEKGQVTSQIWKMDRQTEPQMAQAKELNNAGSVSPDASPRGVAEPANQANPKAESSIHEKVILLLNGPPN
jgi:anti-sigma factor RsiW